MQPLLVVLPFHNGDVELAKRLLNWINELMPLGNSEHSMLCVADSSVPLETCREVGALARKTFRQVDFNAAVIKNTDWRAPNEMFHATATYIKGTYKLPFLWLEPDCVPITGAWLTYLCHGYNYNSRLFMGALVESKEPGLPPLHMTGCGIYPPNAIDFLAKHCDPEAKSAWDIASAPEIVGGRKALNTPLIQSFWGQKDLPPSFIPVKEAGGTYPINTLDLSFLKPEAVLFHRCKDGSLITALQQRLMEPKLPNGTQPAPEPTKNKGGRPRKVQPEPEPVTA